MRLPIVLAVCVVLALLLIPTVPTGAANVPSARATFTPRPIVTPAPTPIPPTLAPTSDGYPAPDMPAYPAPLPAPAHERHQPRATPEPLRQHVSCTAVAPDDRPACAGVR